MKETFKYFSGKGYKHYTSNTIEELDKIAEELFHTNSYGGSMEMMTSNQLNNSYRQEGFIAGVKSDAAKEYWYSQFKKQNNEPQTI